MVMLLELHRLRITNKNRKYNKLLKLHLKLNLRIGMKIQMDWFTLPKSITASSNGMI